WVVGNVSVPDAELSAVSTGILQALLLEDIDEINILTDSSTAINRILDCSPHSGQQYSLAACDALEPWLEANPDHIIRIYYTPMVLEPERRHCRGRRSKPVVAPGQPGRAATAAAVIKRGHARIRVHESRWVVGNVSVPDAELSAVSTGILQALLLEDVNEIDVLTDSSTAIDRILDCSAHSGQQYSIATCDALEPWLEASLDHIIRIYYTPSDRRWGYLPIHAEAHELARGLQVPGNVVGQMTIDQFKTAADTAATQPWTNQFESPSYRGRNFLVLDSLDAGPLAPTTVKGGPWLQAAKSAVDSEGNSLYSNALFARMCRAILDHAPISSFYERFNFTNGQRSCDCGSLLETRRHIL
ncbi:hypothetical protein CVT26_004534, partial [Gymnopilus dilepis]